MSRTHLMRVLVVGAASSLMLLAGCTSADPGAGASPSAAASSASVTGSSGATDSTPTAGAVTIDIAIADDQVSPNGEKINVTKGQTVLLNVTSDSDDEIHAHTSGEGYELEVKAGTPAEGSFVAADTGSFEIESHHLEKIIAILVVR